MVLWPPHPSTWAEKEFPGHHTRLASLSSENYKRLLPLELKNFLRPPQPMPPVYTFPRSQKISPYAISIRLTRTFFNQLFQVYHPILYIASYGAETAQTIAEKLRNRSGHRYGNYHCRPFPWKYQFLIILMLDSSLKVTELEQVSFLREHLIPMLGTVSEHLKHISV